MLGGRSARLRTLAWWSIALGVDADAIADRVNAASRAAADQESPALRLGRVLALRAIGHSVEDDVVQLMTQAATDETLPPAAATAVRDGAITRLLSDSEQQNAPPALRASQLPPASTPSANTPAVNYSHMRIVDGLPRGLITDVMTVAGCNPKPEDLLAGTLVKYGSTGQPAQLALLASDLPQVCRDSVQALVITSLLGQEGASSPDSAHAVLVPLDREFDQCLDPLSDSKDVGAETYVAPVRVRGGSVKPPTKTKDVRPIYSKDAIKRHVAGIVIVDAMISTQGCVSRASILRGVDPLLDVEALRAVIQWKFTPTLLDGAPVPVLMTVTVQFSLQ